jgi:5-methylcytosine-specific restriction protein A
MLKQIQELIVDSVEKPAMAHLQLEPEFKKRIQSTMNLIHRFKKPGDLLQYMDRFADGKQKNNLYQRFKELGLKTFEDICPEIKERFGSQRYNSTNLSDFVIGADYTSFDIAIFAKAYDVRAGIYRIQSGGQLQAVFVKATVGGNGKYANQWLEPEQRLKYYLYSISGKFSVDYALNKALLNSSKPAIYVFDKKGTVCRFSGIYEANQLHEETGGALWCELVRRELFDHQQPATESSYGRELVRAVDVASKRSSSERLERLSLARKKPRIILTVTTTYERNPDVIAEVLSRASGKCERCRSDAPFVRRSDSTPYLEVHHIQFLADGGDDTVSNAMALCPNCHRYLHHGPVEQQEINGLKSQVFQSSH